jgi:hypothetical protein
MTQETSPLQSTPPTLGPTALIRQAVAAHPGSSRAELLALLEPQGVGHGSVSPLLSQLAKRGLLRVEMRDDLRYYWPVEAAAAPAKQPAATVAPSEAIRAEALRTLRQAAAAKAREGKAAKRTAQKAAPEVVSLGQFDTSLPVKPPTPEAPAPDSRKRRVVRWDQAEIEAICRRWAHEHVTIATHFNDKALLRLARLDGFGYRSRDMTADARRAFLAEHLNLLQQLAKEERQAKAQPTAVESSPAAAPVPAQPESELSFGALMDRALQRTVKEAVKEAVAQAEGRMLAAMQEMLKGIPGYNRPIIIKHETVAAPEPAKPKYQVIVVNALPAQFESVKRAYPDLDLRLVEGRMPGEEDPDLVISLTKFMSHPLDRSLRKKYGSRYCPVNGAADSVKVAIRERLQVPYAH